jgi:hypothetical protein
MGNVTMIFESVILFDFPIPAQLLILMHSYASANNGIREWNFIPEKCLFLGQISISGTNRISWTARNFRTENILNPIRKI